MTDNVTKLFTQKTASDPDALLEMAKGDFKSVCLLGVNNNSMLEARATHGITRAEMIFYLEQLKVSLLNAPFLDSDED